MTVSVPIVCTTLVEILCSASGSTLTSATRPPMKIPEYIVYCASLNTAMVMSVKVSDLFCVVQL